MPALSFSQTGEGPALVLLHAFPLSQEMWRSQVADLQGDFRVITPDFRGFGDSDPFDGPPSVETVAADLVELLDELEVTETIILCGLSMGGYTALAFARLYPEWLRALILADAKAEPDTPEARAGREEMILLARQSGSAAVVEKMLPKLTCDMTLRERPWVGEEVHRIGDAHPPETLVGAALQALRDRPDARPGLPDISVPTLVIGGDLDSFTPPGVMAPMAAAIPGGRHVVVEGAGHLANMEQPEAFNAKLREFLCGL